jgi:hypothetical protein
VIRSLLVATVALFAALSVPASAAQIDPRTLVLRQSDVPEELRRDPTSSAVISNADRRDFGARFVARAGRITGYVATYADGGIAVQSWADLFRAPRGAQMMLARDHGKWQALGPPDDRWARAGIGAESWVSRRFAVNTVVLWRYGRVYAGVHSNLGSRRTLALARLQQRRIAAALR